MRRPWFSYYVDDFELDGKVQLMTNQEEGAYHRLLRFQWRNGYIPLGSRNLATIMREPPRIAKRLWVSLSPCFPGGKNPRLEAEREKAEQVSERRRNAGAKGNATQSQLRDVCEPPCDIHKSQVTSHKKKVIRDTWATPFGMIWEDEYHGTPPWGRLAGALPPLIEKHGAADVLDHWSRYCHSTAAQYASAEKFAQTYGSWKPKRELKELPDPLNAD